MTASMMGFSLVQCPLPASVLPMRSTSIFMLYCADVGYRRLIQACDPLHTRFNGSQAIGSVLAEWLLFSMSDYFVITESAFAKTAAALQHQYAQDFLVLSFPL